MPTLKRSLPRALAIFVAGIVLLGCSAESKKSRFLDRADRYFNSGDYEKAKIEYLNVLRADPRNATAIQRLGTIWYEQGAPLRAAPFLLTTRDLLPDDIDSRAKLALVFMSAGQFEEARKEALAILDRSPAHASAMVLLVEASRSQQELDEAEKRIRELNGTNKAGFHLAMAALAVRNQDLVSATKEAQQAVSLEPNSSDAHLALGKLYWLANDPTKADREFRAAADLASARSPARLTYAEFKARTGSPNEARARLEELTRETPDSLQAWRMLAQIAFAEKKFDESLKFVENVLFRDPANIEARLLQAQLWLAKGEAKKGLESLEGLSNSLPKIPVIKYELARAYLQNNNPSQAAVALNQAIAAYPDYTEAILLLGQINIRNGNARSAIAAMRDLLSKQPGLTQAQLILAEAYMLDGRTEDAIALFRGQIEANPKDPEPYLRLGLVLRKMDRIDEARRAFQQALDLAPDNVLAVSQLVELDIQRKDFDAAAQRVQAQLEKTPQSAVAHFLQAKVGVAQGDSDRAESDLIKALELDPNFSSAYGLLISSYLATNKFPQALAQLEAVLAKNPNDARARMLSALIYEKTNEFSKAQAAYEKILSGNPDFAPALNNLAYLNAERLKNLDKALELAKRARALQPSDAAIADTLGWILYKKADYQQALILLRESAQNLPDNPEIQFHLGMANYMMGQMDDARTAFRQAVAAPADFSGKEEALQRLSSLEAAGNGAQQPSAGQLAKIPPEQQPDDIATQLRLAESSEKQGAFAQAAAAYEEALMRNPKLLAANVKLAQLNAGPLKDNEKALKYARKSRELAPRDPKMESLLGSIAYQAGNFSWAYSLLQESAREQPNDADTLRQFAWAAYSLGKVEEARRAMQKVLAAAPESSQSSDAKSFLAMTALNEPGADLRAAKPDVDQLLKANPDYLPALMARASILLQQGDKANAANIYSDILRRFPAFTPALKRLASLYAGDPEKRDEAYNLAMQARKGLPDDPELAQILAELSYQRNEFAYAARLLRQSSEKKPLDAKNLYYLGMSQLKANEKSQGREILDQALAAGLQEPLAADARRAISEFDNSK